MCGGAVNQQERVHPSNDCPVAPILYGLRHVGESSLRSPPSPPNAGPRSQLTSDTDDFISEQLLLCYVYGGDVAHARNEPTKSMVS